MKKRMLPFSLGLLFLTLAGTSVCAQKKKQEFVREKTVTQTYTAGTSDKLTLSNTFGSITVKTWNQNQVKVDVHVSISSNIKENADALFDRINIQHAKNGSDISFTTEMKRSDEEKKSDEQRMSSGNVSNTIDIDYTVMMPASLALDVRNKFGSITLPDLKGKVNVRSQFGRLEAGKLQDVGEVEVRHGDASIESASGGSYNFQFSGEAVIKNLIGNADIKAQHCKSNGVVLYLGSNTGNLTITGQHSDLALVVNKNLSASFTVDTHFGSFSDEAGFGIKSEDGDETKKDEKYGRHASRFNKQYAGRAGSGKNTININGNFSDISVGLEAPKPKPKRTSTSVAPSRSGKRVIRL